MFTLVFALALAIGLAWTPRFLYAYTETDALHLLFAQGFFHAISLEEHTPFPLPWGNLHPLALAALQIAKAAPFGFHVVVLWLAQTVLAGLFAFRLASWLQTWLSARMALAATALALAHPAAWQTLLFSPVHALTAWLFIEALHSLHRRRGFRRLTLSLTALAFCGPSGWLLAVSMCIALTAASDLQAPCSRRQVIFAWLALTPATFLLGAHSINWGVIGGPALTDYPTVFSSISLTTWLSGAWGATVRSLLAWLGHGGLALPFTAPLAGALALLGFFAARQGSDDERRAAYAGAAVSILFIALGAFVPFDLLREQALPILVLLLAFMALGAARAMDGLGNAATSVCAATALAFAVLLAAAYPFAFQQPWEEARYRYELAASIHERSTDQPTAILFTPHLFVERLHAENIEPLGMRIKAPTLTPAGLQSGFVQHASGQPLTIVYPSMRQARMGMAPIDALRQRVAFNHSNNAAISTFRNLTLIEESVHDAPLGRSVNDIHKSEPHSHEQLTRSPSVSFKDSLSDRIVGLNWDFETGYVLTHQVGAAFGFSPTSHTSAEGLRSAGPPPGEHRPGLGTLESIPFTLEGEELRFWANLPAFSTAAFFALAVYSEVPFGPDRPVSRAEHLFHYQPSAPLMGDVFYYIRPDQLEYGLETLTGWRVTRVIHGGEEPGWRRHRWSIDPWQGKQGMWFAAIRNPQHPMWIDGIVQRLRPDGLYRNFEDGTYTGWMVEGEAFGNAPAVGPYGAQQPIEGFEGNFFVNSFHQGSDAAQGRLATEPFILEYNRMRFLVGGGEDAERLYIGLRVEDDVVLRATGDQSEILREKIWDLTPWVGSEVQIEIVDASSDPWGHILVDDIRLDNYAD